MFKDKKEKILGFGIALTSLVFSLVAADMGFRLVTGHLSVGDVLQQDPLVGYRHRPHSSASYLMGSKYFELKINALGLRQDEEVPVAKEPNELRVLFLGDSFTFGWGVDYENTFFARLQKLARQAYPDRPVRFLNGGHGGWGTQQMLAYLEATGTGFAPDLVVLMMGPNDVEDNDQVALYSLQGDGSLSQKPTPINHWNNRSWLANNFPLYQWLLFNSVILQKIRPVVLHTIQLARYYKSQFFLPPEGTIVATTSSSKAEPATIVGEEALTLALIDRVHQRCTENDASLFVTNVGQATNRTRHFFELAETKLRNADYYNAMPEMERRTRILGMPVSHPMDPHYNVVGNALFAETLWPQLKPRLDKVVNRLKNRLAYSDN